MDKKGNIYSSMLLAFYLVLLTIGVILSDISITALVFALPFVIYVYLTLKNNFEKQLYYYAILFALMNASLTLMIAGHDIYFIDIQAILIFFYYILKIFKATADFKQKYLNLKNLNKYHIFFAVFVLYSGVSILWAADKSYALHSVKNYFVIYVLFTSTILQIEGLEDFKQVLDYITKLFIAVVFLSLLEMFGLNTGLPNAFVQKGLYATGESFVKRIPVAFFYNPNNYSVIISIFMIGILISILYEKNRKKFIIKSIGYFISQIVMIFAMSRTAWITLVITLILIVFVFILNFDRKRLFTSIAFLLATIGLFVIMSDIPGMESFYSKLETTPGIGEMITGEETEIPLEIGEGGSNNIRLTLAYNVFNGVFVKGNYFGFGMGNSFPYMKSIDNTRNMYNIHCFWFEILADYGVLIFLFTVLIYAILCFELYKRFRKCKSEYKEISLLVGVTAFQLVLLVFGPSTIINFPIIWTIIPLVFAFRMKVKEL